MGRIGIDWSAAAGKLLDGSYTLSAGITPSFITLTTAPLVGVPWDQPTDVVFTDGAGTVRVRDCRIEDIQAQASESGFLWKVQLADHRWRWLYGCIEAEYNTGIPDGGRPEVGSQQDKEKKSARQLAEILLAAMGESGFDVSALPQDQYPEVKWDCIRPAQALADLCDRYQLTICFDPGSFRVTAAVRGRGAGLYQDSTALSVDVRTSGLKIPERLIAVAERSEYEVSLELEPVGQDIDAATGRLSVKPIDDISYRPAAGWGNDVFAFAGVSETALTDPVTGKKITRQDLAEQTVYRWYRAKVAGLNLPDQAKQPATLRDILPILGKLVDTLQYHDENGNKVVERKAAFVHGIFAADRQGTFDRVASNTVANTVYIGSFSLEEERGLVKFSEPVFRWGASNAIAAATIYLRCIVFGKRYQRARGVGGGHGDETVPVPGVVLQYKDGVATNRGDVDRVLDEVLDYRQALYQATAAGSVVYAGTRDFKLDGMIQQVTWQCGPSGATTQVSASSEHDSAVPSQITRRFLEKQAASAKWAGLQEAGKGTGQIAYPGDLPNLAKVTRWFQAYNPTGSAIAGYSLVRVTAVDATGVHSVAAPNADAQEGLFVTSASPIAAGGYGMISRDWPLPVKYAGAAPSYGDARGAASASHELTTGKKGFIVTGVDAVNGLAKIAPASTGGTGWTAISTAAYTAAPASTSRITMSDTSMVRKGTALRYTIGGTAYYGVVDAISANSYVDVRGAPLSATLQSLEYGAPEKTIQMDLLIPGTSFQVAVSLLAAVGCGLRWSLGPAYLVGFSVKLSVADSTANPKINVNVDGNAVSTNDSNNGVQPTSTSWTDNSLVAISTSNYDIAYKGAIEVACTVAATYGDAKDLSVALIFVAE